MGFESFVDSFDKRTATGKAFHDKRDRYCEEQGGQDGVTEALLDTIHHKMGLDALIETGLAWVFRPDGPGPIDKRTRKFRPIVHELTKLIEASLKLSQAIGLGRKEKPAPSLEEYLASKKENRDDEA